MRRRPRAFPLFVTLLSLLGAADAAGRAPAPAPPAPDSLALRVMSFNIRYGTADDREHRWTRRRDLLLGVIRSHRPDVLGLQEALDFQLGEIRTALPGYAYAGVGRDDGHAAGEYAAVLYRTDRFAAVSDSTFWFSSTPAVAGSKDWGNAVTRICTVVRLRDTLTHAVFSVYNLHLDHESQPSREKSAALLLDRIAVRPDADPVIVTGDFNADEENPAVQRLLLARERAADGCLVPVLTDAYRSLHRPSADEATFHNFTGGVTGRRIDFIFTSRAWHILSSEIVRDHDGKQYPSDHFPVTATVALQPDPRTLPDGGPIRRRR